MNRRRARNQLPAESVASCWQREAPSKLDRFVEQGTIPSIELILLVPGDFIPVGRREVPVLQGARCRSDQVIQRSRLSAHCRIDQILKHDRRRPLRAHKHIAKSQEHLVEASLTRSHLCSVNLGRHRGIRADAVRCSHRWILRHTFCSRLGNPRRDDEGDPGARRPCEPDHYAAIHAPEPRSQGKPDPVAGARRLGREVGESGTASEENRR